MVNGKPVNQGAADNQHARAEVLEKDKLAYAKEAMGLHTFLHRFNGGCYRASSRCMLTFLKLSPDAYPDVLLIPENESMRYFAYSAPLNSYVHHKITSTPVGARMVYPKAFSVLMAA